MTSREPRYGRRNRAAGQAVPAVDQPEQRAWALPGITGVLAFLIYLLTMTPGMQTGDGTELAAVAHTLGIAHPTGYPFYTLFAKLWLILTVGGDPIVRTTLLNAVLMASAAGLSAVILRDVLARLWGQAADKGLMLWAGAGALTVAYLRFHWANAVVTEVYALQFLLMVIFVRAAQKLDGAVTPNATRCWLLVATACVAIGLAHHRLTVTMILPWLVLWVMAWRRGRRAAAAGQSGWRLPYLRAVFLLVLGLSLYAYIPLRASMNPPINWGNPVTVERFYNHVRGTEYLNRGLLKPALGQNFSGNTLSIFIQRQTEQVLADVVAQIVPVKEEVRSMPGTQKVFFQMNGLVVLLGLMARIAGVWALWQMARTGQWLIVMALVLVAAQNVVVIYVYNIADIRDYFLFPMWTAWLELFIFLAWLVRGYSAEKRLASGYLALAIPALVFMGNYNRSNRSGDISAEMLTATLLPESRERVPEGSILITDDDAETFTTWYTQKVRGHRTDVLNFAGNFVYMPWYSAFFTPQQLADYNITLAPAVAQDANGYVQQLRTAIIDHNVDRHPVLTSINDPRVLSILSQTYDLQPVDAVEVTNRSLFDEQTTTVLYRITQKENAQ